VEGRLLARSFLRRKGHQAHADLFAQMARHKGVVAFLDIQTAAGQFATQGGSVQRLELFDRLQGAPSISAFFAEMGGNAMSLFSCRINRTCPLVYSETTGYALYIDVL